MESVSLLLEFVAIKVFYGHPTPPVKLCRPRPFSPSQSAYTDYGRRLIVKLSR